MRFMLKAPGTVRLPSEFYRAFLSDLCIDLMEVCEEDFTSRLQQSSSHIAAKER